MRALAFVVLAACSGSRATPAPPPEAAPATTTTRDAAMTCLATLSVDHHRSVLQEQRSVGPAAFDFFDRYPAAPIDPAAQAPVETVRDVQIAGRPLLWFTADKTGVVVDAAALSELAVVDVTRLRAGDTAQVGHVTEAARGALPGRALALFLIRARAIATYVHIGAELCLVDEQEDAGGYRARFTGEHTYFTNDRNVDPLAFEIVISATGVITVQGAGA